MLPACAIALTMPCLQIIVVQNSRRERVEEGGKGKEKARWRERNGEGEG